MTKLTKGILKSLSTNKSHKIFQSIYLDAENSAAVASNGMQLVYHPMKFPKGFKSRVITSDTLKKAGTSSPQSPFILDLKSEPPTIQGSKATVEIPESEATYPNWKQVIPEIETRIRIGLDPVKLQNLANSIGVEKDHPIILEASASGNEPYRVISAEHKATGILMPMLSEGYQLGIIGDPPASEPHSTLDTPAASPRPTRRKEKKPVAPATEPPVMTRNHDRNGIELRFNGKPDDHTRQQLKAHGFRWGPSLPGKPWYARYTEERLTFATQIAGNRPSVQPTAA